MQRSQGKSTVLLLVLLLLVAAVGIWYFFSRGVKPEFGADEIDLAQLEAEKPLTVEQRQGITPAYLKDLSQEQVDQIYGRLTAGPIPDGPYNGDLFFARGVDGDSRLAEILGGGLKGLLADVGTSKTEFVGRRLWRGKVFYRDQMVLRNRIDDLMVVRPLLGDEPVETIEKITVGGSDAYLLFPAKLYCGQSLLDGRRESLIIDYAFSDELPGYRHEPDRLAGRNGLAVRDEIRMVRPGFYLGRAYLNRVFLLNFTLINDEVMDRDTAAFVEAGGKAQEDCWPGEQQPAATD